MKYFSPKETAWLNDIYNILEGVNTTNSSFLNDRETVISYLKLWDRTRQGNAHSSNIISFEELNYIELKYPEDTEIQNLIYNIKNRAAHLYELKMKWMDVLIDKNILKDIGTVRHKRSYGLELYEDKTQEVYEWR